MPHSECSGALREDILGKSQNTLKSRPGDNTRNKVPEAYITLYAVVRPKLCTEVRSLSPEDLAQILNCNFLGVKDKVRGAG